MTVELVDREVRSGAGREKLRAAALDLFAEKGVSATSLQMIADAMGVTKAAVYHHYRSKNEIVLAVVRPALDQLAEVAAYAERKRSRSAQVEAVIVGLADLVIGHRRLYGLMHGDPTCAAILRDCSEYPALAERLMTLLAGPVPDAAARIAAGMLLAGLRGAGLDPRANALDDEQFHRHLVDCSHRLIRTRRRPAPAARASLLHGGVAARRPEDPAAPALDSVPAAHGVAVYGAAVHGAAAVGAAGAVPLDE